MILKITEAVFWKLLQKKLFQNFINLVLSLKKVKQPNPSFGGKKQEEDTQLYQRSSERLRHKQRAITSWDYERLILQEFPEVYRLKCLNHYRYDSGSVSNVSAGYVTLIPVAKSLSSSTVWGMETFTKLKYFTAYQKQNYGIVFSARPFVHKTSCFRENTRSPVK